jgi:hypothetical protein
VKLSLCLINQASRHEGVSGSGVIALAFLTSAIDGVEWPPSRPCGLTSGERTLGPHWIWGWVGPRAGLDDVEKRRILRCRDMKRVHGQNSGISSTVVEHTNTTVPWEINELWKVTPLLSRIILTYNCYIIILIGTNINWFNMNQSARRCLLHLFSSWTRSFITVTTRARS